MSSESTGTSPWLWVLLVALLAAIVGVIWFLVAGRRSAAAAAAAELAALQGHTRTAVDETLPTALAHEDPAVRAVAWTPVKSDLTSLASRWEAMAAATTDVAAAAPHRQLAQSIGALVLAVDAETEALTQGRDWSLLRPQVEQARAAVLGQLPPPPAPPAAAPAG